MIFTGLKRADRIYPRVAPGIVYSRRNSFLSPQFVSIWIARAGRHDDFTQFSELECHGASLSTWIMPFTIPSSSEMSIRPYPRGCRLGRQFHAGQPLACHASDDISHVDVGKYRTHVGDRGECGCGRGQARLAAHRGGRACANAGGVGALEAPRTTRRREWRRVTHNQGIEHQRRLSARPILRLRHNAGGRGKPSALVGWYRPFVQSD